MTRDGWQENRLLASYLDFECQHPKIRAGMGVDVRRLSPKIIAIEKVPGF